VDSGQFGPSGHRALVIVVMVNRHVVGRVLLVSTLWLTSSVLDSTSRRAPVHLTTAKVVLYTMLTLDLSVQELIRR